VIFAVLILTFILKMAIKMPGVSFRPILLASFIFVLFIFFQEAFRYSYYAQLLPNTYFLKVSGFPIDLRIKNGIGFITPFLKETFLLFFLACLALVSQFCMRRILLLLIFLVAVLYQIWVGGDPWNLWRITAPSMPLIIILAIIAVAEIIASLNIAPTKGHLLKSFSLDIVRFRAWRVALIIAVVLIALVPVNKRFLGQIIGTVPPYTAKANETNVRKALSISDLTYEAATIGVFWAGSIPYYTGREAIDFLGKSDKYIASLSPDLSGAAGWGGMLSVPGHNKYDLAYSIRELKPTYIQNASWAGEDLSQWAGANYEEVYINGSNLLLLKGSEQGKWHKIENN
ncbi:MAG: hypothetical protein R3293_19655, partial [Candidatus Promineifilaceae bacterium]|nr:hypothetical protein [Candidatus Promineifilaceae bacterium]